MNKKDTVRIAILKMSDGQGFNVTSLASKCAVDAKDVANVTAELVKAAVLSKTKVIPVKAGERMYYNYTVDSNMAALWFAKNPINGSPADKPAAEAARQAIDEKANGPVVKKARAKPRSAFIMAIDTELAELERKMKRLNTLRKDYS